VEEDFKRDLTLLAGALLFCVALAGARNVVVEDRSVEVGYTEIDTYCQGAEVSGVCLGVERRTHTTYNYDGYEEAEPGTEDFYRRVESELMLQAQERCGRTGVDGKEWESNVSYRNRTAEEWTETDEVELLPCGDVPHRFLNATS
jgi:hypothetical protein